MRHLEMRHFEINVPQKEIEALKTKVAAYNWSTMQDFGQPDAPWAGGANQAYLKEFCDYWLDEYQWADTQAELNGFPHYIAEIDGIDIHFMMEKGSGTNPQALIMTHGWPGSVYEFLQVIPRLAHPEKFGGKAEDGVSVICPSIPGYAWSGKPKQPLGPRETAALFNKLMVEVLGYETYVAQGGDWGSVVTGFLGLEHAIDLKKNSGGCRAIHLNMYGLTVHDSPATPAEMQWAQDFQAIMMLEAGYLQVQSTKPLALAYAMMDSPVGLSAWILEKFFVWSDLRPRHTQTKADQATNTKIPHLETVYTKHQLLSNIMIYLLTQSFNSASWYYYKYFSGATGMPEGGYISVPVGIANYEREIICFAPRTLVEKGYNITQWTDYDYLGHFAAFEGPETFSADVQKFLKSL